MKFSGKDELVFCMSDILSSKKNCEEAREALLQLLREQFDRGVRKIKIDLQWGFCRAVTVTITRDNGSDLVYSAQG